jgi:LacI family transcriptional regulator
MATLNDVARAAGVSRATVSLVCRNSPLVAVKTRARVERAMVEVGYVYNRAAANLRSSRSNTIGLVIPEIANPLYAEVLAGVEEAVGRHDQQVLVASTNESLDRQEHLLTRMLEMRVDGLIISAATGTTVAMLAAYARSGVPVVQVLRAVDPTHLDYSGTSNRIGARLATQHVLSLGHRRVAFIGSSVATSVSDERRRGYNDALAARGLSADPAAITQCRPTFGDAADAVRTMLSQPDAPTALVCFNDIIAFGATLALYELGLEPGADVAVIGFDDIEWAQSWRPALTTMAIQPRQIGADAGRLLRERLQAPDAPARVVLSEARLMVRNTCAPPRAHQRSTPAP